MRDVDKSVHSKTAAFFGPHLDANKEYQGSPGIVKEEDPAAAPSGTPSKEDEGDSGDSDT